MTTDITHAFVSAVADGGDTSLVRPTDWNAVHVITNLPGEELDYVESPTAVSITATTIGTAHTLLTSNSISFDGSTIVWIEFWAPYARSQPTASARITFDLFIDSTDLGFFGIFDTPASASDYKVPKLEKRYMPSAGSHTFTVKCYGSAATGTVGAGTGNAAGNYQPMWLRVVRK